jgi:hypothetical protein
VEILSIKITTFSKGGNTYTANPTVTFTKSGPDPAPSTLGGRTVDFQADGTVTITGVGAKDLIEYSTGPNDGEREHQRRGHRDQTMNAGEMLRIDFTKDAALAGSPNGSDLVMGTHKDVNDFAFLVSQNTPSGDHSSGTVLIKIFDCNNDKIFTNDTLDTITTVKYNSTVIYQNGVGTPVELIGVTLQPVPLA